MWQCVWRTLSGPLNSEATGVSLPVRSSAPVADNYGKSSRRLKWWTVSLSPCSNSPNVTEDTRVSRLLKQTA